LNAFGLAGKSIARSSTEVQFEVLEKQATRAKRIADAALALTSIKKARVSDGDSGCREMTFARVKYLLHASGRKLSTFKADFPRRVDAPDEEYAEVVALLATAIVCGEVGTHAFEDACASARTARSVGHLASMARALVVLRSTAPALKSAEVYAVTQTTGKEGVSFSHLQLNGNVESVTAGCIVDAPRATVLFVRADKNATAVRVRPTDVA
jgi:hypothetical protein